jgi:hypothetical protein
VTRGTVISYERGIDLVVYKVPKFPIEFDKSLAAFALLRLCVCRLADLKNLAVTTEDVLPAFALV